MLSTKTPGWRRHLRFAILTIVISAAGAYVVSTCLLLAVVDHNIIMSRVGANQTLAAQVYYRSVVLPYYAADEKPAQDTLNRDLAAIKQANKDQAAALQRRLVPEMAAARATLTRVGQEAAANRQAVLKAYLANQGLIPRMKALSQLRAQSASVDAEAWVIEILPFLVIIALFFYIRHTRAQRRRL